MHVHKYEWLQIRQTNLNFYTMKNMKLSRSNSKKKKEKYTSTNTTKSRSVVAAPSRRRHAAQVMTPATFVVRVFALEQHHQPHRKPTQPVEFSRRVRTCTNHVPCKINEWTTEAVTLRLGPNAVRDAHPKPEPPKPARWFMIPKWNRNREETGQVRFKIFEPLNWNRQL